MARRRNEPAVEAGPRLREGAAGLSVELDDAAIGALSRYLDELELWNARANLVGEHDRHTIIDRHLVDALAAVPVLRALGPRVNGTADIPGCFT